MIRMNDFLAEPPELRASVVAALTRVAESGYFVLGPEVGGFEEKFASWTGIPHITGVANGLDALALGLRALGIGPGDEVITTPMTAFATILAITQVGATPVLADIDEGTALLSAESVQRVISPATKALILVHLYGQVKNVTAWVELCEQAGIHLIEDCAQSHGARENGVHCGQFGAFGAFSFYPTKNLGALGDGGALGSTDGDLVARVATLRNYGQTDRYHHEHLGVNSRLDEIQAAVLSEKLAWIDQFTNRRREIASRYLAELSSPHVTLLEPPQHPENHVYHLFVVTTPHREKLMGHLAQAGIDTLIHYPVPAHHQRALPFAATDPQGLGNAERHAKTCLSLPCHPGISDDDVTRVIEAVNSFPG
jgi:dTDP-4-amino-4,6-dideoxygalactose transaminase